MLHFMTYDMHRTYRGHGRISFLVACSNDSSESIGKA